MTDTSRIYLREQNKNIRELDRRAKQLGMNRSEFIRVMIQDQFAEYGWDYDSDMPKAGGDRHSKGYREESDG